jgi:hypothetical protein
MSFLGYKPSDHAPEGLVNQLGKSIIAIHDLLAGPPMTARERIKFQAVRAKAELRILEMCLIGSWNQHTLILQSEELLDESVDSHGTISIGCGGLRAERQSHPA